MAELGSCNMHNTMSSSSSFSIMLPVGIILLILWLTPCNIASLFFLILCLLLIFQMYKLGRAREHRRIRHKERQNADHGKLKECESVQWLNLVFENLWPHCLEKFTSEEFFIPISPWFLNTHKSLIVRNAVLQQLYLGEQPPKCNSLRILDQPNDSNDHHLVMEAVIQFVTGDNMGAKLSVSCVGGIRGTFKISKFQIEGKMKLKVKFINGWPVVGRIQFSFIDVPDVRLIARAMSIDLHRIPGVHNWVERTVALALKSSVVEPKIMVVDMEMLVKNMTAPKLPGVTAKWFSVENSAKIPPPIASICVEILDVQHPQSDGAKRGQWNPFVVISMGEINPAKTLAKRKTTNAEWDKHQLQITSWELPNILILHVFSGIKRAKDGDLGKCAVWINDYKDSERRVLTHSLPLQGSDVKGKLTFAVKVEHDGVFGQTTGSQDLPRQGAYNSQEPIAEEEAGPATTSTIHRPPHRLSSVNRSKSDTQLDSKVAQNSKQKRLMPELLHHDNKLTASTSAITLSAPEEVQHSSASNPAAFPEVPQIMKQMKRQQQQQQKKKKKSGGFLQIFGLQKRRVASYCENLDKTLKIE